MPDLVATRRSLHGVAELLLAGPQHATSGTIRLVPLPGGFATVSAPAVSVMGGELVHDGRTVRLHGCTATEAGLGVGLAVRSLADVYHDGSGIGPDDVLEVDDAAAAQIADAFAGAEDALRTFQPDLPAVLWPEHFDLGITVDEVNYGVSPGDSFLEVPYAYVGPFSPRTGPFWNAPFGAARPLAELPDLAGWFAQGAALASA